MKHLLALLLIVSLDLTFGASAAQALVAGDIAFVGFRTDSTDQLSWIALTNIPAGEVIYFTEQGWHDSVGWYSNSEGHITFTTAGALPCGTIVHMEEVAANSILVTVRPPTGPTTTQMTTSTGSFSLTGGDQAFAYQSSTGSARPASPTFIAGVHSDYLVTDYDPVTTWNTGTDLNHTQKSGLPGTLTNGVNAISLYPAPGPERDNSRYIGTLAGTAAELRARINNATNWTGTDEAVFDVTVSAYALPAMTCVSGPVCGNGTMEAGEACDDGAANGATPCGCQLGCSFGTAGATCGDGGDTGCTNPDSCDGSGACLANHEADTFECRASTGTCDVAETCSAGVCPADAFAASGTTCGDAGDTDCTDPDSCDGSGACLANNAADTFECRASTGTCDVAETCSAGVCPADAFAASGTTCGDAGDTDCTDPDSCDGSGACLANHEADDTSCAGSMFCMTDDGCSEGACVDGTTPACSVDEVCNESTEMCLASCGDGTLDASMGEECDDGADNSDTEPDACRVDCSLPSCGDGVVDMDEGCDTEGASATCTDTCMLADVDAGVADGGSDGGSSADAGLDADAGSGTGDTGGGCAVTPTQGGSPHAAWVLAAVVAVMARRRRRS